MRKGKSDRKRIASVGRMPFWWGSKFNKRLARKREHSEFYLAIKRGLDEALAYEKERRRQEDTDDNT